MSYKLWKATAACLFLGAGISYAEVKSSKSAKVEVLPEVVVSATRTERDKKEVPVSIETVTAEELEKSSGQTVLDSLRGMAGVTIADNGGSGLNYIKIRGEDARRTLIMIDGQPVGQQKSMDGGMAMIGKSQIDRIEVIKGPASVLYGSEAIGGVVNIITKKAGEDKIGGSIGYQYDSSNNGYRFDQSLHGTLGNFEYVLSLGRSDYGSRETPNGKLEKSWVNNSGDTLGYGTGSTSDELSALFAYNFDNWKLGFKYDEFDMSYQTYSDSFGDFMAMDIPKSRREKYAAFLEAVDLTENFKKMRLDIYQQRWDREFDIYNDLSFAPGMMYPGSPGYDYVLRTTTNNLQDTYGASLQNEFAFGNHYLVAGFDFVRDDIGGTNKTKRRYGNSILGAPYEYSEVDAVMDTYAVFLQDEWQLTEKLKMVLGGRYTYVDHELKSTDDPSIAKKSGSDSDGNATFSAGLTYEVNDELTLRANVSQGYRHANLVELYTGSPAHGGAPAVEGNSSLDPETSTSYELGARFDDGVWQLDTAIFYTDTKDFITTDNSSFINVGGAETFGAELTVARYLGETGFKPYASLTLLDRELDYGAGHAVESTKESGVPTWAGRVGLEYFQEIGEMSFMEYDLFTQFSGDVDQELSDGSKQSTGSWETLNLEVSYGVDELFGIAGKDINFNIYGGIYNLLDREYTPFNEITAAGRHYVIGINATF